MHKDAFFHENYYSPGVKVIPYAIRHLFCDCKEVLYDPSISHPRNRRPYLRRNADGTVDMLGKVNPWLACGVCLKYLRSSCRKCELCGTLYAQQAFQHPNWCAYRSVCLTCCDIVESPVCTRSGLPHERCRSVTDRIIWDEFALVPRKRSDATLSTTSFAELDLDF